MKYRLGFILPFIVFAFAAASNFAADGDPDTTFNSTGFRFTQIGDSNEDINSIAIQSDGKIIAVGKSAVGNNRFLVARYNRNGTLDTSFGRGLGFFTTNFRFGPNLFSEAFAVEIQTDGKIVVAGTQSANFALARYNPNGSLDTAFGVNGYAITEIGNASYIKSLEIQPDGKIVAGGYSITNSVTLFALARYSANGSLDTTFSGDGIVTTAIGSGSIDECSAISLQSDGKIVAAGFSQMTTNINSQDFSLVRYNTNGSLDTSFSGDGKLNTPIGSSNEKATSVAIQADGKILASGWTFNGTNTDIAVVRYNSNGTVDPGYGQNGIVQTAFGAADDVALGSFVQVDNRLVVSGFYAHSSGNNDFITARYNTNGSLDTSFGTTGIVATRISQTTHDAARAVAVDSRNGEIVVAGVLDGADADNDIPVVRYDKFGVLDTTFNSIGAVVTRGTGCIAAARDMAIQSDGKIVVAGETEQEATGLDFALARYNSNGTPDTTFGSAGKLWLDIGATQDHGRTVAIQPDGKIIVAGYYRGPFSTDFNFALARFNSNGTLDTSFSGDGKVTTSFGSGRDQAFSVGLQSTGKIILAGAAFISSGHDFALARYNADGTLDTSFDVDGIVVTPIGPGGEEALSMAILPDDRIITTGKVFNGTNYDFAAVRYNPDGSLDTTFSFDGKVTTPIGTGDDIPNAVALQADGKVVVSGYFNAAANNDFAVVRYNANGSLDTTFSGDGIVTTPIGAGHDAANSVAIQADGKIVVAGSAENGIDRDFAIVRYNPNGTLDSASFASDQFNLFGTGGIVRTDFGSEDEANVVAIQSNGRIVVAGYSDNYFAIARYQSLLSSPRRPLLDFDGDGKSDISIFRPSVGEWYYLSSLNGNSPGAQFGNSTDKIAPADYTGDGKADFAFFRPSDGHWYIIRSENQTFYAFPYGANGDIPAPGDFDGDGKADATIFRPSAGLWASLRSSDNQSTILQFGANGDIPVVADYDGDGKADFSTYRPSAGEWYTRRSSNGSVFGAPFGAVGDKPVQGDYTGDGKADFAVFRPSSGFWYVLRSEDQSFFGSPFGNSTDTPTIGDYDGDGKNDFAVFRPSTGNWFVQRSTAGFLAATFGVATDRPAPAYYLP